MTPGIWGIDNLTLGHDSVNVGICDRPISGGTFFWFREMGLRYLPPTHHTQQHKPFALLCFARLGLKSGVQFWLRKSECPHKTRDS